jgi:hypothetical protein
METKIQGVVIKRHDVEKIVGKKEYESLTVLVEVPGKYPKQVAITFFNNVDKADALDAGVEAEFSINLESKEYNGKYYHNINCWSVNVINGNEKPKKHNEPSNAANPYADSASLFDDDVDTEMPF